VEDEQSQHGPGRRGRTRSRHPRRPVARAGSWHQIWAL